MFAKSALLTDSDNWFQSGFYGSRLSYSMELRKRLSVHVLDCDNILLQRPFEILNKNISCLLHKIKLQILNVDTKVQGRINVKGTMTLRYTSFSPVLYAFG